VVYQLLCKDIQCSSNWYLYRGQIYNSLIESKTKNIINTSQQNNDCRYSYDDHDNSSIVAFLVNIIDQSFCI
jgi:hypothetical protein